MSKCIVTSFDWRGIFNIHYKSCCDKRIFEKKFELKFNITKHKKRLKSNIKSKSSNNTYLNIIEIIIYPPVSEASRGVY